MGWLRNKLKNIPVLKKLFYCLREYTPQRIYFEKNLKRMVEFDRQHGTNFSGRIFQEELGVSRDEANDYSPSPLMLTKTLDNMNIQERDYIVDLGCGKGYAMYLMSKYNFGKIGGWNCHLNYTMLPMRI